MFLLVSGRHAGAHPNGHRHGVPIQIFTDLGKKFLRMSCLGKIAVTWVLASLCIFTFLFPGSGLNLLMITLSYTEFKKLTLIYIEAVYWTVLIFILIYFERRDTLKTSNYQYFKFESFSVCNTLKRKGCAIRNIWKYIPILFNQASLFSSVIMCGNQC